MPLGTLDRTPPPFFRQGTPALTKLALFSALALFLMAADTRFQVAQPLRAALAFLLYPVQWTAMQPVFLARFTGRYLQSLESAHEDLELVQRRQAELGARAGQVELLTQENARLRQLLGLRETLRADALAAQVLYDAADPFTRKVVLDRGMTQGVKVGSPVIDEHGVLGQVTRVYPMVSEVTLLTDRDQSIPVLNTRTGARSLAFGDPGAGEAALELRFVAATADVLAGDQLSTSGVDGVYPAGLAVATVLKVERRADSPFARISCATAARSDATRHVLILKPQTDQLPPRPLPEPPAATPGKKKEARK
jgi:rod shape-determining protein MreC